MTSFSRANTHLQHPSATPKFAQACDKIRFASPNVETRHSFISGTSWIRGSPDHLLAFIYLAYFMMASLLNGHEP
jgi:hypothetical protein